MMYKQIVYTSLMVIITAIDLTNGNEQLNKSESSPRDAKAIPDLKLGRIISMWNRSSENSIPLDWKSLQNNEEKDKEEEFFESSTFTQTFPEELSKCLEDHRYQISENYSQGKNIILNCFKATVILNLMKYMNRPTKSSIKLFNGLVELKKIQEKRCENGDKCNGYFDQWATRRTLPQEKKNEYVKMYKKAMQKLVNRKNKLNLYRNLTEEQKADQLNKINEGSQAFLSEVIKNLGNEDAERIEEEKIQEEITDPRLMSVLDAVSKNYMLKLRFYPGVSARMMRSFNGGVTFDLELDDANNGEQSEEKEEEDDDQRHDEEITSDEESTREIKDYKKSHSDIYFDDSERHKGKKGKSKNKKKVIKKKAKKLKKILPYLLIPVLIQMALLPFVFKKLFFLAMKALLAGKVALILVAFNLLRNHCIENEDSYSQRIRVEHYGYNKGEEYGAWVNGRSSKGSTLIDALREEPYRGHQPASS